MSTTPPSYRFLPWVRERFASAIPAGSGASGWVELQTSRDFRRIVLDVKARGSA